MKRGLKVVAVIAGGLLLFSTATAIAANRKGRDGRVTSGCPGHPGWGTGPGMHMGGGVDVFGVAAEYLGVTEDDLRARLQDGETLAEIAEAEGKSVDGLVDALVTAHEVFLQGLVDQGTITAAQRDAMLEHVRERMEALVNGQMGPGMGPGGHMGGGMGGSGMGGSGMGMGGGMGGSGMGMGGGGPNW